MDKKSMYPMKVWFLSLLTVFCNVLYAQKQFIDLVNMYRQSNGVPPIVYSEELSVSSRKHNLVLVTLDTAFHSSVGCGEILTRGEGLLMDSVRFQKFNAFTMRYFKTKVSHPTTLEQLTTAVYMKIIQNFDESPAHKRQLLSRDYRTMGIGVDIRDTEIIQILPHWKNTKYYCLVKYSCVINFLK